MAVYGYPFSPLTLKSTAMTSFTSPKQALTAFGRDVLQGLSRSPKSLPSKYFYDEEGDRLFQEIMRMPEYYLTDAEHEILTSAKEDMLRQMGQGPFDLVELGAGDGFKTKILLGHFLQAGANFEYLPVDISANVLDQLEAACRKVWPSLQIHGLAGDYFKVLGNLAARHNVPKLILYLGSTIGNLGREKEPAFLRQINQYMNPGDKILIGFDLKKDPQRILDAYNDPAGITAAFNLNLLRRINRELQADFDLQHFRHWETYNPANGEARSYLVSLKDQDVHIARLGITASLMAWEAIEVELSQKYSLDHIESLANQCGYRVIKHYLDEKSYFADSLWEKAE